MARPRKIKVVSKFVRKFFRTILYISCNTLRPPVNCHHPPVTFDILSKLSGIRSLVKISTAALPNSRHKYTSREERYNKNKVKSTRGSNFSSSLYRYEMRLREMAWEWNSYEGKRLLWQHMYLRGRRSSSVSIRFTLVKML